MDTIFCCLQFIIFYPIARLLLRGFPHGVHAGCEAHQPFAFALGLYIVFQHAWDSVIKVLPCAADAFCSLAKRQVEAKTIFQTRMTEKAAFYERLKKSLEETSVFPSDYMFKFVFPSDAEKLLALRALFEALRPRVSVRASRNAKYTSVTVRIRVPNAETVIVKYREASKIKGMIIL